MENYIDLNTEIKKVHGRLEKKFDEKYANRMAKDALVIQEFLQKIKSFSDSPFEDAIIKGYEQTNGTTNNLFREAYQKTNSKEPFEQQLTQIFNLAINQAIQESNMAQVVGTSTGITKAGAKNIDVEIPNQIIKALKDKGKTKLVESLQIQSRPVQGKVDVQIQKIESGVLMQIEDKDVRRFLKAISGKTYSLKNYSKKSSRTTLRTAGLTLGKGDASLYKSISGGLLEAFGGMSVERQQKIFSSGLEVLAGTAESPSIKAEDVSQHFSHLRFIYELRGSGLYGETDLKAGKSLLPTVDFLIWNNPNGSQIEVESTAKLVYDLLTANNKINLLGHNVKLRKRMITKKINKS